MSIDFQCERCGQAYRVDDDKAGLKLRCQVCAFITPIPARQAVAVDSFAGAGDQPAEEPFQQRRAQRPPSLSRSGKLKSSSGRKKKSQGNAVPLIAAGVALVVVLTGTFFAVRALRKPADDSIAAKSNPKQDSAPSSKAQQPKEEAPPSGPASPATEVAAVADAKPVFTPSERFKQIGEAIFKYQAEKGTLPMSTSLSWRVHLLPYLGKNRLHSQFKLDEPWDSPENISLLKRMPEEYASSDYADDGKTRTFVFTGPGTLFNPGVPAKLSDITDNPATTLLVVEAFPNKAAEWTKPADLEFKGFVRSELGLKYGAQEGIQALMADGNVVVLAESIPPLTLRALVSIAGRDEALQLEENVIGGKLRTAPDKAPAPTAATPDTKPAEETPKSPKAADQSAKDSKADESKQQPVPANK